MNNKAIILNDEVISETQKGELVKVYLFRVLDK